MLPSTVQLSQPLQYHLPITQRSVWDLDLGLPTSSILRVFGVKTKPVYVQVRSKQFYRVTSTTASSLRSPCYCLVPDCSPLRSASQKPTFFLIVPCLGPSGRRTEKEGEKGKGFGPSLERTVSGSRVLWVPTASTVAAVVTAATTALLGNWGASQWRKEIKGRMSTLSER